MNLVHEEKERDEVNEDNECEDDIPKKTNNDGRHYEEVPEDIYDMKYKTGANKCEHVLLASRNIKNAVLDCGCTKTVAGYPTVKGLLELLTDEEKESIERKRGNRHFEFGNGVRYPSKEEVTIPIGLGKLRDHLDVSVVDTDIPLLIGAPDMKRLGLTVNFEKDKVFVSRTGESLDISKNENNHLTIPLTTVPLSKETHAIMSVTNCETKEKKKKIKRVHHVLGHPREEALKSLFKDSSQIDEETMKIIEEVSRECSVCIHHRRTPSRPKVGLPLSKTFNQCVAIDLKDRKKITLTELWAAPQIGLTIIGKFNIIVRLDSNQIS